MTVEIVLVLLVTAAALVLFATERMPVDMVAILLMVTMIAIPLFLGNIPFLLRHGIDLKAAFPTIEEGLSGLSSPATITVLAMFILSAGVQRSGLVHELGKRIFPIVGNSELRQVLMLALVVGTVSGFINNTAAVAVMLPMVMDLAKRSKRSPAKLLMPLSFLAQLGGTLTLIGTSTNLLVASIVADPERGFGKVIGMFEFTKVGLIVLGAGILYFVLIGRWLLPDRPLPGAGKGDGESHFLVELRVPEGSNLIGRTLAKSGFITKQGAELVRLQRGETAWRSDAERQPLAAGDVLLVRATPQQVMELMGSNQVKVLTGGGDERRALRAPARLVQVMLRSPQAFGHRRVGEVDFGRLRARLVGVEVESLDGARLVNHELRVGEIVLLSTSARGVEALERSPDFVVMEQIEDVFDRSKQWPVLLILAGVVLIPAFTTIPILLTSLVGVILMVLTGVLPKEEVYGSVSWDVIFLIAGVIPLAIAMNKSGTADWLALHFVALTRDWSPLYIIVGLYVVTTLLTEVVSNNAAAVIVVPIAIAIGEQLGLDPFPLVLAVMFAASTTFLTPVGYQTNTMIYGTGVYRFLDFARVGAPLNVLLAFITTYAIAHYFPPA